MHMNGMAVLMNISDDIQKMQKFYLYSKYLLYNKMDNVNFILVSLFYLSQNSTTPQIPGHEVYPDI